MTMLVLACALFLGIHVFISGTPLRGVIVGAIGEKPYAGLFSLASLGAIVWMSFAYADAPYQEVWFSGPGLRHGALILVLIGILLVVLGMSTPNPTSAGQEGALQKAHASQGIIKVTRHPFLWGVVFWAVGHLMANGDVASIVLFGSLLILALVGPFLIDAKRARKDGEAWTRFAAETSWLPFAAIAGGRTKLALGEIGWWRIALAIVIYLVIVLWAHEWVFGVSPMPV
jgi:uncharacterized membrane protein